MGSEAPRRVVRIYPDAAQLGIGTGITIGQSRITFTGPRGMVLISWRLRLQNAAAVAIAEAGLAVIGTTALVGAFSESTVWFEATAGIASAVHVMVVVIDPAPGSFLEIATSLTAGTVDVNALSGTVNALSFEPGTGAGPIVTIS